MTVDVKVCLRCKLPQEPASPDGMQVSTTCTHCGYIYYGYDTVQWPVYPPRCPFCDDAKTPNLAKRLEYVCKKCNKHIYLGWDHRMHRYSYFISTRLMIAVMLFALILPMLVIRLMRDGLGAQGLAFLAFQTVYMIWLIVVPKKIESI